MSDGKSQLHPIAKIRDQLRNFEESVAQLLELAKLLPAGDLKQELFYEVGYLDSIADAIRQRLDSCE